MKVGPLHEVWSCHPSDVLSAAAQIMERDCGCVPITDSDGHLVGLVSLNDISGGAEPGVGGPKKAITYAEVGDTCRVARTARTKLPSATAA